MGCAAQDRADGWWEVGEGKGEAEGLFRGLLVALVASAVSDLWGGFNKARKFSGERRGIQECERLENFVDLFFGLPRLF